MKSIKGFEGFYSITHRGEVYSHNSNRFLKKVENKVNGYLYVTLSAHPKREMKSIHRLVAETFLKESRDETNNIVNHKDGDKHNNHVTNLEWCSYSNNIKHAYDT